jgi:Fic family protein
MNDRQRVFMTEASRARSSEWTIEGYQGEFGVAYGTARADLLGLESLGYLTHRKIGKRFVFRLAEQRGG